MTAPTDDLPFYELYGLRPEGDVFTIEVLDQQTEQEARRLAAYYASRWRKRVRLCRVPGLNLSSVGWQADQMDLVAEIDPET